MGSCDLVIKSLDTVLTARDGELPNHECPLCHDAATAVGGDGDLVVCLDGTAEVVCRQCAAEHDPALAQFLFPALAA